MNWLREPGIAPGKRTADVDRARSQLATFKGYENRWDLLESPTTGAPVLLPSLFRDWALETNRVGLPEDHPWRENLPEPW